MQLLSHAVPWYFLAYLGMLLSMCNALLVCCTLSAIDMRNMTVCGLLAGLLAAGCR